MLEEKEEDLGQYVGLNEETAKLRLLEQGFNEIADIRKHSVFLLFIAQFKSPLVLVLIFACVISFLVGEQWDAVAIAAILLINAFIGFFLEHRAEASIQALQGLTAPHARVLRDGKKKLIFAKEVVNEDVVFLEAGDLVCADLEILEASTLLVNEAVLTGESFPIEKTAQDEKLFMGTTVVAGTAVGRVLATGMKTELGKIARLMTTAQAGPTPLQAQLKRVGNVILLICFIVVCFVVAVGILKGMPWSELLVFSMSLAVAAVPEGMPAIVTIALALGVQKLSARNALIRSLPTVETLGCVSVICTDKTGTLTTGEMRVRELWGKDHAEIIYTAASCCDSEIESDGDLGIGDPTEIAILLASRERNFDHHEIEISNPRLSTQPFDPERRLMSIYRRDGRNYVKGAVESLMHISNLDEEQKQVIRNANDEMASRGLRVLGVAKGSGDKEQDLQFLGMIGIADPPRTEVIEAIKVARGAGILTVMITGDHAQTAAAIAREIGIVRSDESLESRVHARATPEEKLNLVRSWKSKSQIVAMTGDGVNDAPALREAHVGIAMGKSGSEVTRQSAGLVLADDNYATIIAAVREGRQIYKNIRRAIVYLLTGNVAELFVVLAALVGGFPLPLLAAHLLWINLVTDALPALTLMAEAAASDIMKSPPRPTLEKILGKVEWMSILGVAFVEGAVVFGLYLYSIEKYGDVEARGMVFSTLVFSQLFRSFGARSTTRIFWKLGMFSNLWLLGVVTLTALLQFSLHYFPVTQTIFRLSPLIQEQIFLILALSLIPVSLVEIKKLVKPWLRKPV